MKLIDYIADVEQRFSTADLCYGHGTDNAADEAWYLVLAGLGIAFENNQEELTKEVSQQQIQMLESAVTARIEKGIPVAYLVGKAWFAGHEFISDERALVPRSPIAELIRNSFQPLISTPPSRLLDLCAGGGCIGIACALEFPAVQVDLVDISPHALELAEENIQKHQLQERVAILQSDLFSNVCGRYDLIVSNPPYVSADEFTALPIEYHHEPSLGLITEDQGMAIPLAILRQAETFLTQDGVLVLELGFTAQALSERLTQVPLLWLEFAQGGSGVLAITAGELRKYRDSFN